jgi:hypothetical protein
MQLARVLLLHSLRICANGFNFICQYIYESLIAFFGQQAIAQQKFIFFQNIIKLVRFFLYT